jgi:hypothetical protein
MEERRGGILQTPNRWHGALNPGQTNTNDPTTGALDSDYRPTSGTPFHHFFRYFFFPFVILFYYLIAFFHYNKNCGFFRIYVVECGYKNGSSLRQHDPNQRSSR